MEKLVVGLLITFVRVALESLGLLLFGEAHNKVSVPRVLLCPINPSFAHQVVVDSQIFGVPGELAVGGARIHLLSAPLNPELGSYSDAPSLPLLSWKML
jgi:hypothetical protein